MKNQSRKKLDEKIAETEAYLARLRAERLDWHAGREQRKKELEERQFGGSLAWSAGITLFVFGLYTFLSALKAGELVSLKASLAAFAICSVICYVGIRLVSYGTRQDPIYYCRRCVRFTGSAYALCDECEKARRY